MAKQSLRAAINAKCKSCVYDNLAPGNWRQQTQGCTVWRCPLYSVRPVSSGPVMAPESDIAGIIGVQG